VIDAAGGTKAAGGVAAQRSIVGGQDDGDRVRNAVPSALFHAVKIEQPLDAPTAIGRRDVSGVEIAGGGAGMIEVIDFADIKLAARVEADTGGDGLAIFFDDGQDGRGAGGELFARPNSVEALLLQDLAEEGKVRIGWVGDPMK